MKKFVISLVTLLVLVALCIGGYVAWAWYSLDESVIPSPLLSVEGKEQVANEVEWKVPIAWGLIERAFERSIEDSDKFEINIDRLNIKFDESYNYEIAIKNNEKELFRGGVEEYKTFTFPKNDNYTIDIGIDIPPIENTPYGNFLYAMTVLVDVPPPAPILRITSTEVVQGDTIAVELENIIEGVTPTIETDLSPTIFMNMGQGKWISYIGVADARDAGEYSITVSFGDVKKEVPITVTSGSFNRQDLTIDTSAPAISEANSPAAYAEFRETIPPFYETIDENLYWNDSFIQPVEGRLTSEYGLLRYTNGGKTPRRHAGIDIATAEGTPIVAPANGKVVFSQRLLNTGNTLVIEHGGGLKTYYYHLVERTVKQGDVVLQSDLLGKVGTTGYSTGPHLHFEIRIGSQNLDPFKFFNGTGGCFNPKTEIELNS